jgi:hypothetical protein
MLLILVGLMGSLPLLVASLMLYRSYRKPGSGQFALTSIRGVLWVFWGMSLVFAIVFVAVSRFFFRQFAPLFEESEPSVFINGALFLAAVGLGFSLLFSLYRRSSPQQLAPRVLIVVEVLGLAGLLAMCIFFREQFDTWGWIIFFLAFATIVFRSALEIMDILPYRSARTWSEHHLKIPLRWTGAALFFGGVVLAAIQVIGDTHVPMTLPLAGIVIGIWLFAKSRHLQALVSELPAEVGQTRIGALYLRAFKQEKQIFALVPQAMCLQLDMTQEFRLTDEHGNRWYTFEQYLQREIVKSIGPFLALGSPEDISPPSGAARLYVKDSDWMKQVADLARRATCILMDVGSSQNLRWELAYLRSAGLQQKLFLLTPPEFPGPMGPRSKKIFRAILDLATAPCCPEVSFLHFANDLSAMGYHLEAQTDPGPGTVLTFDTDGNAIVLVRGAATPVGFVSPIRTRVLGAPNQSDPTPSSTAVC